MASSPILEISADQISALLDRIGDDGQMPGADEVQAPIPSVLTLDRPQEERLIEHCLKRVQDISQDLGRDLVVEAAGDGGGDMEWTRSMLHQDNSRPFMVKRRVMELLYNLRVEWREWVFGGIFSESNYPVPMSRRLVQQQISRAVNYFFGTDPWLAATPEGAEDDMLAKEIDRYAKWKARKAKIKNVLVKAVSQAFIRGEGIVKTTYADADDYYYTMAEVAVDEAGNILVAQDGDYIFRDDIFVEAVREDGVPMGMVLKRDGVTPQPPSVRFEVRRILRSIPVKHGADMALVHFLDFLCPLNAPTVDEADIVCHLYEAPALHVAQMILNKEGDKAKIMESLRHLADGQSSTVPRTGQLGYRPDLGEGYNNSAGDGMSQDKREPRASIAECWVRFDVDGDGVEENLFVVIDKEARRPIYYDYAANITPSGRRPFHIVRCETVDNRWHGMSQMELFEDSNKLVDLMLNRIVFATSQQAAVKFWQPSRTIEGQADPNLRLNGGETYTPVDNTPVENILSVVPIYEPAIDDMREIIEFCQQHTLNMSGVGATNDANAAGLDTQKTATGIRNLDRTGQELFAPFLYALEEGLQDAVEAWLDLELYYLDQPEVYEYFEGETRMQSALTPETVRDLKVNIRLELTRYRNEQQDIQLTQSVGMVQQFYQLPYPVQVLVAPMFRQLLKLRDIQYADSIIQPVDLMAMGLMPGPGGSMVPMTGVPEGPGSVATPSDPATATGASMPGMSQGNV